eukprot:CAMPEP_0116575846 /NCGR_PEP_ID=MMETSP0397-20121206/20180_1 /TAXON_ID=216820 /ORGANISM="Cyclophora tenuis, Strain ECT3854" /LENGTH=108 /DNA_ID=CAMNT_0004104775 /DNA_START=534 /DNA_END=860 /DNA_ORIENTATION=-
MPNDEESNPISAGMLPVMRLLFVKSLRKLVNRPISVPIDPDKRFLVTSRKRREDALRAVDGNASARLLTDTSRVNRFGSLPSIYPIGMVPLNEFEVRTEGRVLAGMVS